MKITLNSAAPGRPLKDLYGLFFEDINHAADGGLYAELLRNRDFEFDAVDRGDYTPLTAWAPVGNAQLRVLRQGSPFPRRPRYALVKGSGRHGLCNLGFGEGIPVKAGAGYRVTLWARASKAMKLTVRLCDANATFSLSTKWQKLEALLTPTQSDPTSRLTITAEESGRFDLAFASLMPLATWPGQANMLRRDLCEALAAMKPRFLRFPGGCLTHDGDLDPDSRTGIYNWKRTVGPVENRPPRRNNWGYHQTMGLGFYEYFLLCEDLGCQPLPVLNGGIDPHHRRFAEGETLEKYIQDALDLIDFAKGGEDTEWGRVRIEMGHPAPFSLKYLAIGNEEIHEQFHQHMALFATAIRKKDPEVELIGSSGPFAHGGPYDMGWDFARQQRLNHVDEHFYMSPEWFLSSVDRYVAYDPEGPNVFLGEYASWGNKMRNALAEAAFMTSLENASAVSLACYAPMLCNAAYANWKPDMLFFDGESLVKTVNYHTQSLFMRNQGDRHLSVTATDNAPGADLSRPLAGKIVLLADDTELRVTDIRLQTAQGISALPDCVLSRDGHLCLGEHTGDFHLALTLERLSGKKGANLRFAFADRQNFCNWVLGGWQNSDAAIESTTSGCNACLTQSNFSLETGRAYRFELALSGQEILTRVDGEVLNRVVRQPLCLRPLYLSAALDEASQEVILKAVNVQAAPVEASIALPCAFVRGEMLCADPQSENTFEHPCAVEPAAFTLPAGDEVIHTFPGHSITVLRFQQK